MDPSDLHRRPKLESHYSTLSLPSRHLRPPARQLILNQDYHLSWLLTQSLMPIQ